MEAAKAFVKEVDHKEAVALLSKRVHELEQQVSEQGARIEELEEERVELKELAALAYEDSLTGLRNRRGLEAEFNRLVAALSYEDTNKRKDPLSFKHMSALYIDLNKFKEVNDTLGHKTGDRILIVVADIIKSVAHREFDITARDGGDEFVVILPGSTPEDARAIAEKIRQYTSEMPVRGLEDEITMSIGVSEVLPGDTIESAKARADDAMYIEKRLSRES